MSKHPRCPVTGKYRYPTREKAIHAALVSTTRRQTPLRIYVCPDCGGGFHLTKRPANPTPATVPGPFTPADLARMLSGRQNEETAS